jgi:hypothetical protein
MPMMSMKGAELYWAFLSPVWAFPAANLCWIISLLVLESLRLDFFFYFPDIFLQKFKMKMNYFDELVFKNTFYKLFIIIIWRVAPYRDCNGDFLA